MPGSTAISPQVFTPDKANTHKYWLVAAIALTAAAVLASFNLIWPFDTLRSDNDAMLRLVQVRDLLAGQNWFDTYQYRMGVPGGFEMHWSRLIDAPIAGLILLAQMFGNDQPQAEHFAISAWPILLSFIALFAALRIAYSQGGLAATLFTALIAVPNFQLFGQFNAGQIDHHNAQTVLALSFIAATVTSAPRVATGALAGLCLALMSGIGAETQVHVLFGGVAMAMLFWLKPNFANFIIGFGLVFAFANLAIFVSAIPAEFYTRSTCDAFSIAQALPSIAGGLSLAGAAIILRNEPALNKRLVALLIVGLLSFAAAVPTSLGCVGNPLAGIDPLVQKFWLAYVKEAMPFLTVVKQSTAIALAHLVPTMLSLGLAGYLIFKGQQTRLTALLLGGAIAISLAISLFQFRAIIMAAYLAVPLLGIASAAIFAWADGPGKNVAHRLIMAGFVLVCFGHSWVVGVKFFDNSTGKPANQQTRFENTCSGTAFIALLNTIPQTTLMAVSNLGPDILIDTPHHVLAGPYHRNIEGLRSSINTHILPSNQAKTAMIASGASHYVWCKGANEAFNFAKENGFAADMMAGKVPAWLEKVAGAPDGQYAVYKIRP